MTNVGSIAVVGIGARLPGGVVGPDSYWRLLVDGRDAIVEVPGDRWSAQAFTHADPGAPGASVSRWGGFVSDLDRFDPGFFGISPREAARMDPQQRLLLKTAWEALEDAGIAPGALRGARVGVFVGISNRDYGDLQHGEANRLDISAHTNTGAAVSIAANRISHLLDLRGPSLAVDTACSSSLVAVHLACQSLRSGESTLAIVGGVNALLRPEPTIGFSKAMMLSPDGRCRSFDARANGYVRAEGAGVVVLKPLEAALRDGDPIYAAILASAVNQDGHTQGITVPDAGAQAAMLGEAYARAGVPMGEVDYVEAHGTGTPVGDPIEARALGVLGRAAGRRTPLYIGSVKSNIGHLESGAGMAGLIKVALAMKHGRIPRTLHLERPSPDIDFEGLALRVVARPSDWPRASGRAVAGVNSFGFGGTNAHVVLGEVVPEREDRAEAQQEDRARFFTLSARSPEALDALALEYVDHLSSHPDLSIDDVCHTAIARRDHHTHRLAVVAPSTFDIVDALSAQASGTSHPALTAGVAPRSPAPIVFVYSGMGPQWWGMGRRLLDDEPVFRAAIEECDAILSRIAPWSLLDEMRRTEAASRMGETAVAQPASFALQVALTALWRSWGITPAAVVGHSAGEAAAAWASGAYSLEEACRVIFHRSRIQQRTAGQGTLVALHADPGEVRERLRRSPGVELAAVNAPQSMTLVGKREDLAAFVAPYVERGAFVRFLKVDVPFHGAALEPHRRALEESLGDIRAGRVTIPIHSTVTAGPIDGTDLLASYWWRNVRQPVLFADTVAGLARAGFTRFLEIGPHPVLVDSIRQSIQSIQRSASVQHSLRRDVDEARYLRARLAELYVEGSRPSAAVAPGRHAALPTYEWIEDRCWQESPGSRAARLTPPAHPLLGARADAPGVAFESVVDLARHPWLADHRIEDRALFPAAAHVELAIASASEGEQDVVVEHLGLEKPLFLDHPAQLRIQRGDEGAFAVHAREEDTGTWVRLSRAVVTRRAVASAADDVAALRARCGDRISPEALYTRLATAGFRYGPRFRGVTECWLGRDEALGALELPSGAAAAGYLVHPILLDAALHVMLAATFDGELRLALPVAIARATLRALPPGPLLCHARLRRRGREEMVADVRLLDPAGGRVLVSLEGVRCRAIARADAELSEDRERMLLELTWERVASAGADGRSALPPLDAVAATMAGDPPDAGYRRVLPRLEAAALAFQAEAVDDLAGGAASFDALALAEKVDLRHRSLFARILAQLTARGALERSGRTWRWRAPPMRGEARRTWEAIARDHALPEVELLGRSGPELARVLRGQVEGLALLFPQDGSGAAARFYAEGAMFAGYNDRARRVVRAAVEHAPSRGLRALEIGGGTGSLTAAVLEELPADRGSYLFTDVAPTFLSAASARFAGGRSFETALFDVSRAPEPQGIAPAAHDLVLASNVLHATRDLRETLAHVRALLAPGGWLVLLEATTPSLWLDLVFGLTDGWWQFADRDLRTDSPLLAPEVWRGLLAEAGFDEVIATADEDAAQTLFVGRAAAPGSVRSRWGILSDGGPLARAIAGRLEAAGDEAVVVPRGGSLGPVERVVLVHTEGAGRPAADGADAATLALAEVARELVALEHRATPRLDVVTAGARAVDPEDAVPHPEHSAALGLLRVVQKEHWKLHARSIDLPAQPGDADLDLLVSQLRATSSEPEVALRRGAAMAPRILPASEAGRSTGPYRLEVRRPGELASLELSAFTPRPPAEGEVAISVRAAGLNFKEVLKASGRLSDAVLEGGFSGHDLGMECAGIVSAVGPGVERFRPGDAVVALARSAIASAVITKAELVAPLPSNLSFVEAAALPVVFLTAAYGLEDKARLSAGERVLVHAAAGGVGHAAREIARRAGAEVIASAGSEDKRAYLREQGVRHVVDSRGPFADDVLAATGGKGVDVVLNALAGAALDEGLRCLAPYGRFVEIGKQDIDRNRPIGLGPFGENLSFSAIDIDRLIRDRAPLAGAMLRSLMERFARGELVPPPITRFPIQDVEKAFRLVAQAKHVGKVVIELDGEPARVRPARRERPRFRRDGTYVVTGGLGGLGLKLAEWLASRGAGHVALLARREPDPAAQASIATIEQLGATVQVERADVTREDDVRACLSRLRSSSPPIRGVFHTAMIIRDALVEQLERAQLAAAMAPKVLGALHLHEATLDDPLDCFVLCSSISAVVGAAGQGNYVAGNAFLDALAHHRSRRGLPALSVAWGAFAEAGYVARNRDVGDYLERTGLHRYSMDDAMALLERALSSDAPYVVAADVDWQRMGQTYPLIAHNLLARVQGLGARRAVAEGGEDSAATRDVRALAPEERQPFVESRIAHHLAGVLQSSSSRIDVERRLSDIGLDSLLSVELSLALSRELRVDLPVTEVLRGPTVRELAQVLIARLTADAGRSEVQAPTKVVRLNGGTKGSPLFMIPAGVGEIGALRALAERLGDHRCFALEPPTEAPAAGDARGLLDALVERYADAIRGAGAPEPWSLVGYSTGGLLALEVARRLARGGHSLGLLCLIDSPFRRPSWYPADAGGSGEVSLTDVPREILSNMLGDVVAAGGAAFDPGLRIHLRATETYVPEPYGGKLTYVGASRSPLYTEETHRAWAAVAEGGFDMAIVDATHYGVLRPPHIDLLANTLASRLDP